MLQQKELIREFLNRNGPSLPVEVGKELGYNSLLTKAVLVELVNEGELKQSKRTIGNSLLYYLDGQERQLRKRLFDDLKIPERHTLNHLREAGKPLRNDELTPQERFIINSLYDFVNIQLINNQKVYSLKGRELRPIQITPKPVVLPERPRLETPLFTHMQKPKQELKSEPKIEPLITRKASFDAEIMDYLKGFGEVSVKKVVRRDRETNYVLKTGKPFIQSFFVKSKNKQRINESDLSLIYTETLKEKMPGILITKGNLTSTAKKWMKENIGDLIKLIKIK